MAAVSVNSVGLEPDPAAHTAAIRDTGLLREGEGKFRTGVDSVRDPLHSHGLRGVANIDDILVGILIATVGILVPIVSREDLVVAAIVIDPIAAEVGTAVFGSRACGFEALEAQAILFELCHDDLLSIFVHVF
jgi:hypothetical protein